MPQSLREGLIELLELKSDTPDPTIYSLVAQLQRIALNEQELREAIFKALEPTGVSFECWSALEGLEFLSMTAVSYLLEIGLVPWITFALEDKKVVWRLFEGPHAEMVWTSSIDSENGESPPPVSIRRHRWGREIGDDDWVSGGKRESSVYQPMWRESLRLLGGEPDNIFVSAPHWPAE